jgi:hydroxylamine reductase
MFCFQCEQTAKGTGCTISGVCGKKPEVAGKHDELTAALIGLARAAEGRCPDDPQHVRNLL